MQAIGMDLGGTNIRAARVDKSGIVSEIVWRKTPVAAGPEVTARTMAEMIAELSQKAQTKIKGVGIGSPGPLSRKEKKIFQTPNLPGFENFPLGQRVQELSSVPVDFDHDARCATYGEGRFGVAQGLKNFILLTFGTGIGGGIVSGGQMLYGKEDAAGELGHLTLYPEGRLCKCGNRGCFEQYASASAVERRASEIFKRAIAGPELLTLAEKNDPQALTVLREVARDISYACASLVNALDPEMIVLAGGLFTSGGGPLCDWVKEEIRDRCFKSAQVRLRICASKLQGEAGILGAASLVLDRA